MHMQHYYQLLAHLRGLAPLAVAFSGGIDSTLLAKAAHDALGDQAIAITVNGPMQLRNELAEARSLARHIGIRQVELPLEWQELPALHTNPADRCYLCKQSLLTRCRQELVSGATPHHDWHLADGSNHDDLQSHRPGRRALQELAVASPLAELGFTKAEIRALNKSLGLPGWDRPAQSCLLTRFPHDTLLGVEDLRQVEDCEGGLRELGLAVVRVRRHGAATRLELGPTELAAVKADPLLRQKVETVCIKAGFVQTDIDPAGYRCGSMD